ncbi:MAG: type II secretion system protein [Luteolibacter sp.]|uniref:type II secretion system protein n=1 Tax=Luteolibacter sp. TaxID=1962973 RepID=UPI0032671DED
MTLSRQRLKRGFLLLEMVLALGVFGIAATGFAVALKRMAQAAQLAQSELRITRILDSAIDETLSLPTMEEGETSSTVGETEIELLTKISLIEDLQTEDGQQLAEMFHIEINAKWFENGAWQERAVDTWRYGRMYQTQ